MLILPVASRPYDRASISYRETAVDLANATTYNGAPFTGVDIGPASNERWVLIAISGRSSSNGNVQVSSASIGGIAMSLVARVPGTSTFVAPELWIAKVPASVGATANFSVTFAAAMVDAGIAIWALYNLRSGIPVATNAVWGDLSTPVNVSVNVPSGGVAVGFISDANASWGATGGVCVGITERFELAIELAQNVFMMGGDYTNTGGDETPHTITLDIPDNGDSAGTIGASFR